jgi:hypothetical protein
MVSQADQEWLDRYKAEHDAYVESLRKRDESKETITPTADALESAIDRLGLGNVIAVLADICYQKAQHIQSNWQDESLARQWVREGKRLDRVAAKVEVR